MIYNLGKYPHIQDKIYQEVESVVGKDGDVTTKHLAKVSYLKAFIRESMRCAPYCLLNFNGSLIFFYCNNHFESLYPVNNVIMYFFLT